MSSPDIAALTTLDRGVRWTLEQSVDVQGEVGHPQGLLPWGEHWLVSTVHLSGRGELLVVDVAGEVVDRRDVTDGVRFHPGGVGAAGPWCAVPVAEYRPDSSTVVLAVSEELEVSELFRFDDHLGAVADLGDGTLFAVSWGSRTWYRLDLSGAVLDARVNTSWFVDHQDLTVVDAGSVVATGVAGIAGPGGGVQLGGLAVVDVASLRAVWEVPVQAWMPSGRVATYNGAHVGARGGRVVVSCLVDDRSAAVGTWVADR